MNASATDNRMQVAPMVGSSVLSARIAFCCCSTYADAERLAGLKPTQIPNIVPTSKASSTKRAKRRKFCVEILNGGEMAMRGVTARDKLVLLIRY